MMVVCSYMMKNPFIQYMTESLCPVSGYLVLLLISEPYFTSAQTSVLYFFLLDLDKAIHCVCSSCLGCNIFQSVPVMTHSLTTSEAPSNVGTVFTCDIYHVPLPTIHHDAMWMCNQPHLVIIPSLLWETWCYPRCPHVVCFLLVIQENNHSPYMSMPYLALSQSPRMSCYTKLTLSWSLAPWQKIRTLLLSRRFDSFVLNMLNASRYHHKEAPCPTRPCHDYGKPHQLSL